MSTKNKILISIVLLFILILSGCTKIVPEFFVSLGVNKAEGGDVRFESSAWANQVTKMVYKGTDIKVFAVAETGYEFNGWYENGTRISTENPFELEVNSLRNLYATFRHINGIASPETITINEGSFQMGDEFDTGSIDEKPLHNVTFTRKILMGRYEINNEEFTAFMNDAGVELNGVYGELNGKRILYTTSNVYSGIGYNGNSWYVKTEYNGIPLNYRQMPVVYVTWIGAVEYCNWLSEENGMEKAYVWDTAVETYKLRNYAVNEGYRLPTEAEWEYAARGGENLQWAGVSNDLQLVNYALYYTNSDIGDGSGRHVQVVGQKLANGYNIKDMSGNASEWCSDNWYLYTNNSRTDPYFQGAGTVDTHSHVIRGGSFANDFSACRIADRFNGSDLGNYFEYVGFRVARHP
jgi:formylglycine-generating enzyme required for sulfatase activity